jgi:hypothetical protein
VSFEVQPFCAFSLQSFSTNGASKAQKSRNARQLALKKIATPHFSRARSPPQYKRIFKQKI